MRLIDYKKGGTIMALKITIVICATLVILTLISEKGKGGR